MTKTNFLLFLILIIFACKKNKESKAIQIQELTISEIHEAYKNDVYSSEELIERYIDRIKNYDSVINSITFINPRAIEIARSLDDEFRKTKKLRPLHGIPLIIKDNINYKGLPTTAGSLALKDYVPTENAHIIDKLVDAGAIVLGKSNLAEWAFSPRHTESSTNGTTHNPYNTEYVPAGSSGGTAAAIASNFGTIGLGTDTGNSIRGPSSHCALVGFRTTMGLTSRNGIVPLLLLYDVVGPMCRTVEDATKVMEVISGVDSGDSLTYYSKEKTKKNYTQFLKKDGLQGARIGVLRSLVKEDTNPEIKSLFEQAINDLERLGAEIVDPFIVENFDSLQPKTWCLTFRKDLEEFLASHVKDDSLKTLEDLKKIGFNSESAKNKFEVYASANGRYPKDDGIPCGNAYIEINRKTFRNAIEQAMDSLNVHAIIYPSWTKKHARIDFFEEDYGGDNSQIIAPETGQPAFTVPMGFISENLPSGLQFLGRMYDEPTLIKLAYAYEQGTLHRKEPTLNE